MTISIRRAFRFIILSLGALASTIALAQPTKPAQIVVNASGGAQSEALRKAIWADYEKQYGIKVLGTSPIDFGKLRAMVETKNPQWDLTEVSGFDVRRAVDMGLTEPIDPAIVDRSKFIPTARDPNIFASAIFSTIIGFRADAFPNGGPKSWADFWDVSRFPGPRALRNHPAVNLEIALLADGVAPDKLYPLDVDRAFRKLDALYPQVSVWWTTGQQPPQLLIDKEVALATGWSSRYFASIRGGAPIRIEWEGGVMQATSWVIPKGARNKDATMKLLAMYAEPRRQAQLSVDLGSSGTNTESTQYVPADIAPLLPLSGDNPKHQVYLDEAWWEKNGAEMLLRWNQWMLSKR